MKIVTIDEDIVEFLRAIYFGTYTNPYEAASNRAYLDMNRTIRFNGMPSQERDKIRKKVTGILEEEIKMICAIKVSHQEQYDIWHFYVCDKIRKLYRDNHIEFYYGQAQKWVNMTMKYLYIIGECAFDGLFQYLHAPLDKYVFDIAKKEEGIKKPKVSWSRWDDYQGQYISYQNELRSRIRGDNLLRWEFKYWLKEARKR